MELKLKRTDFTETSTIGELSINGVFECYVLEDKDRGLTQSMSLAESVATKVHGKTAIPYGTFKIVVTKSERFSKMKGKPVYLPLLLNVPNYAGVRIHTGNKPEDTEGCLLPARKKGKNFVSESTLAFTGLNEKINKAIKAGEIVTIEIVK